MHVKNKILCLATFLSLIIFFGCTSQSQEFEDASILRCGVDPDAQDKIFLVVKKSGRQRISHQIFQVVSCEQLSASDNPKYSMKLLIQGALPSQPIIKTQPIKIKFVNTPKQNNGFATLTVQCYIIMPDLESVLPCIE